MVPARRVSHCDAHRWRIPHRRCEGPCRGGRGQRGAARDGDLRRRRTPVLGPDGRIGRPRRTPRLDRHGEDLCPSGFRRRRGGRIRCRRHRRADPGARSPGRARSPRSCSAPRSSGILETVLDFTIQWGFDRHSFGRPIGSYQALKHKYADLKIWFESCRATTNAAVAEVAARSPGAEMAVSVAKSYVGEHAPGMLQDCIQLHGGIGVTWEHDLHIFLRRVDVVPLAVRHTRGSQPPRVRADQESGARVMTETASAPTETTESVERVRGAGPYLVGGEHATDRPGEPARARPGRRRTVAARPGAAEEAVRGWVRGDLLPA